MNAGEVVHAFLAAMEAAGVCPVEPIAQPLASGELIRFRCEGDKPGRRNGWARLHLDDRPAGVFGNYRMNIRQTWSSAKGLPLPPGDQAELRRKCKEDQKKRERERRAGWEAAAVEAARLWGSAGPVRLDHGYIARKGMAGEDLRQLGEMVLVPMRDGGGRLWNLQRIWPDGSRRFLKGARTDDLFWLCGSGGDVLCIGEGVATMAAVRAATGHPVAAAMSGPNVEPVACLIRRRWPALQLIICADDDAHLVDHPQIKKNLGIEYARAAAAAVGARLAVPGGRNVHG